MNINKISVELITDMSIAKYRSYTPMHRKTAIRMGEKIGKCD